MRDPGHYPQLERPGLMAEALDEAVSLVPRG